MADLPASGQQAVLEWSVTQRIGMRRDGERGGSGGLSRRCFARLRFGIAVAQQPCPYMAAGRGDADPGAAVPRRTAVRRRYRDHGRRRDHWAADFLCGRGRRAHVVVLRNSDVSFGDRCAVRRGEAVLERDRFDASGNTPTQKPDRSSGAFQIDVNLDIRHWNSFFS